MLGEQWYAGAGAMRNRLDYRLRGNDAEGGIAGGMVDIRGGAGGHGMPCPYLETSGTGAPLLAYSRYLISILHRCLVRNTDLRPVMTALAVSVFLCSVVCFGNPALAASKKWKKKESSWQRKSAPVAAAAPAAPQPPPPPLPPSGEIPAVVDVFVTGKAAPKSFYLSYAAEVINSRITMRSSGNVNVGVDKAMLAPARLKPGKNVTALVPVRIYVPGHSAVQRHVVARITNISLENFPPPDKTVVSNSPESVTHEGELISGDLRRSSTARFVFHHTNSTGKPMKLVFFVENTGSETALLRVSGRRDFRISTDEMAAGHKATLDFMSFGRDDLGIVIEIPPGAAAVVARPALAPSYTISGMLDAQALRGDGLRYSVRMIPPGAPERGRERHIGNYTSRRAHGEFQAPVVNLSDTYIVNGKWRFLSVGDPPIYSIDGRNAELLGNYGVMYNISVLIENPGASSETVQFDFAPAGGPALGAFYFDGKFYDVKLTRPPHSTPVAFYTLGPGESRTVNIMSMPEAGSNYPVRLVVKKKRT